MTDLLLSSLVSPTAFKLALSRGHISERAHEENPQLRVYSYTKQVQFSGLWTAETRLARGLILEVPADGDLEAAVVRGRGLPKFFTVAQLETDWSRVKLVDDDENVTVEEAPEISWDAPAHVADKLNGALGLAYLAPDGRVSIATKGSFGSVEALVGTRIMRSLLTPEALEHFTAVELAGRTPLFEIITPERPHPVDYGTLEALIYLGSVEHSTGEWTPATADHALSTRFGFTTSEVLPHRTLKEAVTSLYRPNTEGMVVTIGRGAAQELYKVKPQEYMLLRSFFYATAPKDLAGIVQAMSAQELAAVGGPEDISLDSLGGLAAELKTSQLATARRAIIYTKLVLPIQQAVAETQARLEELLASLGDAPERREVATVIGREGGAQRALLFKAYDGRIAGDLSGVYDSARIIHLKSL
jgi:hypothetical protein